jgi:hypothetical protein
VSAQRHLALVQEPALPPPSASRLALDLVARLDGVEPEVALEALALARRAIMERQRQDGRRAR